MNDYDAHQGNTRAPAPPGHNTRAAITYKSRESLIFLRDSGGYFGWGGDDISDPKGALPRRGF